MFIRMTIELGSLPPCDNGMSVQY